MKQKVVVVGIDGATWKVLNPLMERGELPFIKQMTQKGAHGILRSPIPPLSAPSWVTFATGVNPGKHGVFDFVEYRSDGQIPVNSTFVKTLRIWDILGHYKKKSLVINLPVTYPLSKMNGTMVSCFLTPKGSAYVYPRKYKKILDELDYEIDIMHSEKSGELPSWKLSKQKRSVYLEKLINISRKRTSVFIKLFKEKDYDFSFILYKESDIAQHLFWGEPELEKYFKFLDKEISSIYDHVAKFDGNTSFILMSDHGFHKSAIYQISINELIRRLLKEEKYVNSWTFFHSLSQLFKRSGFDINRFRFVNIFKQNIINKKRNQIQDFIISQNGIYFFNPQTKLQLQDILVKSLRNIKYKGELVFKLVSGSEQVYKGEFVKKAPDIVWVTNNNFVINTNPFVSKIFDKRENTLLGEHISDPDGIYIILDKFINIGKGSREKIENINTLILHKLGITVPWYSDGVLPKTYNPPENKILKKKITNKLIREINNLK